MTVRAISSFVDETGRHSAGDVFEMADGIAVQRIKAGLVQRVAEEPLTATMPERFETAVTRRGKR
jgi:hypothetical protein